MNKPNALSCCSDNCTKEQKGRDQMKDIALVASAFAATVACGFVVSASAREDARTVVVDQVRAQQHPCGMAEKAECDEALSKPDAVVWILTCDNASYQVRLHPDMAADIKKLE